MPSPQSLVASDVEVLATANTKRKNLALKGLCHAILGNFGSDQLVIKLTEISQ